MLHPSVCRSVLRVVGLALLSLGAATPVALGAGTVLFDEGAPAAVEVADARGVEGVRLNAVGVDAGVSPAAGARMLRLRGARPAREGASYAYATFWKGRVTIGPKTRLSYCVYARPESVHHAFAIDLAAPNFYPDNLRDRPQAVDQFGTRAHPAWGFQMGRNVGRWSYREIALAPLAGKEATAAYAAWDSGGGSDAGEFAGYFDEVLLWESDDPVAARRAQALRARFEESEDPAPLSRYPAPVVAGKPKPMPEIAVPSPTQVAGANARRGRIRLGANGYFCFANGEAFLPWGLFGSEIYPDVTPLKETPGAVPPASGPALWWSHVPWGGAGGHNSEPQELDEGAWDAYFAACARRGITALRLFTYGYTTPPGEPGYYFSLDAVGKVHPVLWAKLDRFMRAGYAHGIRFLFTLLASPDWQPYVRRSRPQAPKNQVLGEAKRQYSPEELDALTGPRRRFVVEERTLVIESAFENAPFFEDPDVAACVEGYLRDLLPRLAGDPRVFALEVMNETFSIRHPEWARDHVVRLCRELAPGVPVMTSHTLGSGVQSIAASSFIRGSGLDAYNWHSYFRTNSVVTQELTLNSLFYNAPVPGFPTEGPAYYGGVKREATDETLRRLAIRDYLWLPFVTGCPGSILWAPENPAIAPWEWVELRTFHRVLRPIAAEVDFARLERHRPRVGISLDLAPGTRLAYASYLLRRGVPFEFAPDVSGYVVPVAGPVAIGRLRAEPAPVQVIGSECAPLLADKGMRDVILYVPNLRKGRRGSGSRRVELMTNLPRRRYRACVYDIDAETQAAALLPGHGRLLVAAASPHDFVVWLRAADATSGVPARRLSD